MVAKGITGDTLGVRGKTDLCDDDVEVCRHPVPRFFLDADFNVAVEGQKEDQQPLHGEAVQASVHNRRHFGLIDAQEFGGVRLGQVAVSQYPGDVSRQFDFCQAPFRKGQSQVGKDVAAAFFNFDFVHFFLMPTLAYLVKALSLAAV